MKIRTIPSKISIRTAAVSACLLSGRTTRPPKQRWVRVPDVSAPSTEASAVPPKPKQPNTPWYADTGERSDEPIRAL